MIDFKIVTTKTGDNGTTSLYNGDRVRKDNPVMEALGDIDELNSWLGSVKAEMKKLGALKFSGHVEKVQRTLFNIASEIATPKNSDLYKKIGHPKQEDLDFLEEVEQEILTQTNIGNSFILPGVNGCSSKIDITRAVCRRAERKLVYLIIELKLDNLVFSEKYVNRLSDFLFILGRHFEQGQTEKM